MKDDVFHEYDRYDLDLVKDPFLIDNDFMSKNQTPLKEEHLTPVYKDLDWSEFLWGTDFLLIKGRKKI